VNRSDVELEVRRILVALDTSPNSLAALSAAVDLAQRTKAEVIGLFVEDEEMLSVAEVPYAREIVYLSAREEPLDRSGMERKLRTQSEVARKALESAAEQANVRWSFRKVRGDVGAELLAAAADVDLVAIGKVGWSIGSRIRIGSTALELALGAVPLLLSGSIRASTNPHVFVYYDGSTGAQRAVRIAARIAKNDGGSIVALLNRTGEESYRSMESEVTKLLSGSNIDVRFRYMDQGAEPDLVRAIGMNSEAIFVVGGREPLKRLPWLETLLRRPGVRLLLLQDGSASEAEEGG
jgi:nucleotide-binding universal stress UspA family protein